MALSHPPPSLALSHSQDAAQLPDSFSRLRLGFMQIRPCHADV